MLDSIKAMPVACFIFRALNWFKQIYGFHFDDIMSDNGAEFRGTEDHPLEYVLKNIGITHTYTPPRYSQPNGKVEAFFKIVQNEFIRSNHFKDIEEFKEQLGSFIFHYNHSRRHGGIDYLTPFEKIEKVTKLLT